VVAAVAAAAAVDALWPDPPGPVDERAAAQLQRFGVSGLLVYTDADCELRALSLPELTPAEVPQGPEVGCEISVSPDGRRVAGVRAAWRGDSSEYASCGGGRCPVAWRGDELTFVEGGAIRSARGAIIVPPPELERVALDHPNATADARIETLRVLDLEWLDREEVAALIEVRYVFGLPEAETLVAGFRDGSRVWSDPFFSRFERLVLSSTGDFLLEPVDRQQLAAFAISPTGPADWSPDGLRVAVATRASVFVADLRTRRLIRIPITARDLAWR
jgi:hypothetical protein